MNNMNNMKENYKEIFELTSPPDSNAAFIARIEKKTKCEQGQDLQVVRMSNPIYAVSAALVAMVIMAGGVMFALNNDYFGGYNPGDSPVSRTQSAAEITQEDDAGDVTTAAEPEDDSPESQVTPHRTAPETAPPGWWTPVPPEKDGVFIIKDGGLAEIVVYVNTREVTLALETINVSSKAIEMVFKTDEQPLGFGNFVTDDMNEFFVVLEDGIIMPLKKGILFDVYGYSASGSEDDLTENENKVVIQGIFNREIDVEEITSVIIQGYEFFIEEDDFTDEIPDTDLIPAWFYDRKVLSGIPYTGVIIQVHDDELGERWESY